jgi:imidazolonepropionase-like amidohydrolase
LAGTDGGILQHELELYSDAGIPNAAVLKMATYWPAKLSGKDNVLGSIREGKIADLVLVDGNPLERMEDIRKIYVTIKEGKLYWPKEIYKQFGWGYYY